MPIDVKNDDLQTALKKLKARENSFRLLEKINKLGSWEVDLITHKSIWSENSYKLYEIEPFSIEPTLELFFNNIVPEDVTRAKIALNNLATTHEPQTFQTKLRIKSGKEKNILINAQAIFDEHNTPIKLVGTTQDITEQVQLKEKSQELSSIIENSSTEIYIVDYKTEKYLYVNAAACNALGYTKEEMLNNFTVYDINKNLTHEMVQNLKREYKTSKQPILTDQNIHTRKDGTSYHIQSHIQKIQYEKKEAYIIFDTDVTQNMLVSELADKQSEMLYHQANHDRLTGLPNRSYFQDRLSKSITAAHARSSSFALLFIDLDHFKDINDSLGHDVGDKVLQEVSSRLIKCIREDDTLARLGGDEFTIILEGTSNLKNIYHIADKIIATMKEPIHIFSNVLHITTSIGISIYPEHATQKSNLLKYADTAMYKAKEKGRNNYQVYSVDMTVNAFKRVVMENSLRVAVKEEQFEVYHQPQIDASSNTLIGMEALVRWNHPTLGLVPPMDFIPLAEELGLIIDIDKVVMYKAMQQFVEWNRQGLKPGKLSLNLSMQHLNSSDFIQNLMNTMKTIDFDANWLGLEVTETQVMKNPEHSIKKLIELSEYGIDVSVDDFGTGYSSLSYLKKLPLKKLKIDKSFIDDIPKDEDDIAITKAIISLAKNLNLGLVAEGVETAEQLEFLIAHECTCIQGYLYSKPLTSKDMTSYLKSF